MTPVPYTRQGRPFLRRVPGLHQLTVVRALARWTVPVLLAFGLLAGAAGCDDQRGGSAAAKPEPWPTATALTWQWQLSGELDLAVDADVFELDAFTTPTDTVQRLRARGRRMICYVNVGAYEASRPDAARFPVGVLGAPTGRLGERWLDVRQWQSLRPILLDRLALCRGKGFQAVDLDSVDGYANPTGFPLTADDQLLFNRRLAALARSAGLSPGLKNDVDQVAALEPDFDFTINEGCYFWGVCERLRPFVKARKPVFHVEYDVATADFCATTLRLGFASIRKDRDLGAWRMPCLL